MMEIKIDDLSKYDYVPIGNVFDVMKQITGCQFITVTENNEMKFDFENDFHVLISNINANMTVKSIVNKVLHEKEKNGIT